MKAWSSRSWNSPLNFVPWSIRHSTQAPNLLRTYCKKTWLVFCEAFLHTFHNKICTHKTQLGVELLCSCILTSKVVQCNVMKFIKNLLHCVHMEDTKKDCGKKSQLTMIEREGTLCWCSFHVHAWWLNPLRSLRHHIFVQLPSLTYIGFLGS